MPNISDVAQNGERLSGLNPVGKILHKGQIQLKEGFDVKQRFYNVSTVRLMRFLYSLGFEKESYIAPSGKENWRFAWSDDLEESLSFYYSMRKRNKELTICQANSDTKTSNSNSSNVGIN